MKRKQMFITLLIMWITCAHFWGYTYAQEENILIQKDKDKIKVGDIIELKVTGKDLKAIAGGDISILYNPDYFEYVKDSFHLHLKEEAVMEFKKLSGVPSSFEDGPGSIKIGFGMKKNTLLLENDPVLGSFKLKAIKEGVGEIKIDEKAAFIEEKENTYSYVKASTSILTISILKKEEEEKDPCDFDGKDGVDLKDLIILSNHLDTNDSEYDLNQDGKVDTLDMVYLSRRIE